LPLLRHLTHERHTRTRQHTLDPHQVGLGLNFVVNGTPYVVPMAVEEPSIIAAASGAAKLVAQVHAAEGLC
jgi:hypothetical protein